MKKAIQLEELVCPMCAGKIETALNKTEGVISASVSYNASKAKVEFDETKIGLEKIIKVITDLGYEIKA